MFWITVFNSSELFGVFICVRISSFFMCAFVLHLSCCPVIDFSLKAHSNLDALRASNTNPANFVLHEITDSCERLFQRFGIGSNVSAIRWKKLSSVRTALAIRLKKKCYPFEWLMLSVWENLSTVRTARTIRWKKNAIHPFEGLRTTQANPFEKNCHSIEQLRLSVGKIVIRSRCSGYPFEENCNPFERLELSRAVRDESHVSLNNSS